MEGIIKNLHEFTSRGYLVFGIDNSKPCPTLQNFKRKQKIPFMLLSDPKKEFIGFFGASKDKGVGILRSHVFVKPNSVIEAVRVRVKPLNSVNQCLEFVKRKKKVAPLRDPSQ